MKGPHSERSQTHLFRKPSAWMVSNFDYLNTMFDVYVPHSVCKTLLAFIFSSLSEYIVCVCVCVYCIYISSKTEKI